MEEEITIFRVTKLNKLSLGKRVKDIKKTVKY